MGQFRHSSCGTGLESGGWTAIGIRSNSSISIATGPKLDHYGDGKSDQVSVASLKFKIMMQICQDNHKDILNGSLDRVIGMECRGHTDASAKDVGCPLSDKQIA